MEGLANLYVKGYDLDWHLLHQGGANRKIALPTYPFTKERYWVPEGAANVMTLSSQELSYLHPLVDANISTVKTECFVKRLNGKEFYLNDHRIKGDAILPGVAYLEMARAAGALADPDQTIVSLKNIIWARPIRIHDQSKAVTISLYPEDTGTIFEITTSSDETGQTESIVHAQGKLIYGKSTKQLGTLDIATIKEHAHRAQALYTEFKAIGIQYGPSFQVIQALWRDAKEAMSILKLSTDLMSHNQFVLHPSLMDGALQTAGLILKQAEMKQLYLPFSIGQVDMAGSLPSTCYVHATLISAEKANFPKFDIKIADESGKVLVYVKDFTLHALQAEDKAVYYYQPVWKQQTLTQVEASLNGPYLVLDETSDLVAQLKEKIPQQTIAHAQYLLKLSQAENYLQLIKALKEKNELPEIIVYRISSDAEAPINDQLDKIYDTLLYLSQGLIEVKLKNDIRFICITDSPIIGQTIAGFIKTLHLEQPKLMGRVLEITNADKLIDTLLAELNGQENEVRYDANHTRWVKSYEEVSAGQTLPIPLKKKGVYLITGGLGGLGMIFARYLAEHYQAKLVLTGRSTLKEKQQATLTELEKLGGEVIYVQGDITKIKEAENIFKTLKTRFGKLNGIIHSAGVVRDAFILKKTKEASLEVLSPKIIGTINLDNITSADSLDFFVMFSSVASLFGNAGQCDYAFANGFMDAFADHRTALTQQDKRSGKTISINWPLWAEGGMKINETSQQWLQQTLGVIPLSTREGIAAFIQAISAQSTQCIILAGQHKKLLKLLGKNQIEMISTKPSVSVTNNILLEKVQSKLLAIVSETLKIKIQYLNADEDLSEYGVDSITITAIINQLNHYYNLELTPAILFEHKTLKSFAEYLVNNHQNAMSACHGEALSPTSISCCSS